MNLSLPREVLLERNLVFHEDWANIGHEDIELGYRWTQAGYDVIYNPKAWGEHFHPHDLDSACRLQHSVGRGLRDLEVLIPEPRPARALRRCSRGRTRPGRWPGAWPARRCSTGSTVPPLQRRLGAPRPAQPPGRVDVLEDHAAPHRRRVPGPAAPPAHPGADPAGPAARRRHHGTTLDARTTSSRSRRDRAEHARTTGRRRRPRAPGPGRPSSSSSWWPSPPASSAPSSPSSASRPSTSSAARSSWPACSTRIRDLIGPPLHDAVERVSPRRFRLPPTPTVVRRRTSRSPSASWSARCWPARSPGSSPSRG